ncbi:TPM domain-containing protein [Acetivibrio straminisolvens]|uniref:Uncharacterized protein n=1 Tax=Acetivibrio straminisolvens JCM 21531 TaxID=1294263 RepID=W4V5A2_9FIRM|nr:TPM domain-containing protein [Acetivibrio straminisolvens]GAE88366.1 hypothetical protein JCM21531_1805 [Acetivibrio straminisolvens JCM 21531]
MHKKTRILVLALFFLTFISYIAQIIAFAESSNNVIDYLNYLTDSEVLTLQTEIDSIKKNYRLDVVIVITDDTQASLPAILPMISLIITDMA